MASEIEIPSVSDLGDEMNEENVMKILVASDNHLGYLEKDPIRGEDSFVAFEEILKHAVANDVDFILLGGDLFHYATPSQYSIQRCMELLRKYTLGSKPISLEFLSDQTINFADCFNSTVNFEDPNINVAIPVFSIHGNHDDPSDFGLKSVLDIFATAGLVNYFGKRTDLQKLEINPILLRKGVTQLAIYGLSFIHDSRLVRLFQDSKVIMKKPDEETGNWFNLMVLHQNRANRGTKNYIPEDILPEFLDLIIWGHEHDCRIIPEQHYKNQFHVCQPGSSTPTSLCEGESIDKHCGILHIFKDKFKLEPIPLKTVRPFIFKSIDLEDYANEYAFEEGDAENKVIALAKEQVEMMILEAQKKLTSHPRQPTLPLIRLRLNYEKGDYMLNEVRFGQQYSKRVANHGDLIKLKKVAKRTDNKFGIKDLDRDALSGALAVANTRNRVEDVVDEYFEAAEDSKKLKIMSTNILNEVTNRIVNKSDLNAADSIMSYFLEKANEHFLEKIPREDQMEEEYENFKSKSDDTYQDILNKLDSRGMNRPSSSSLTQKNSSGTLNSSSSLAAVFNPEQSAKTSTQKTARGRGAGTSTRGRGRGRGASSSTTSTPATDTAKRTTKQKMPSLMETLGATSKAAVPKRDTPARRNASKAIYISDSD